MLVKSGVTLKDNIKFLFEGEEVVGLLRYLHHCRHDAYGITK